MQHWAPSAFLADEPAVALSLELLLPCRGQAELQTCGPRRAYAVAGPVLGRVSAALFHFFDYAGVLLHAYLSGAGTAGGQCAGDCQAKQRNALAAHRLGNDCLASPWRFCGCWRS